MTHRAPYPPEFRAEAIQLIRSSGKSLAEIGRELQVTTETLRIWSKQADIDDGVRNDGLTTEETDELRRLRRENQVLKEEREILKKAAAFFAKETDSRAGSSAVIYYKEVMGTETGSVRCDNAIRQSICSPAR